MRNNSKGDKIMENEATILSSMQICRWLTTICLIVCAVSICERQRSQIANYKAIDKIQRGIIKDLRRERRKDRKKTESN